MKRNKVYTLLILCAIGVKAQHNIVLEALDAPLTSPFKVTKCGNSVGYLGKGLPANSADIAAKQTIEVDVTSPGPYNFVTNTENGVTFKASGNFTTTGIQTVEMTGEGTPVEYTVDNNTFTYTIGVPGEQGSCSFGRKVYVPDQNYTGSFKNDGKHRFLYKAITGYAGKTWLQTNLGAHYNQVGHPQFNPEMAATGIDDYLAFGSLFQVGRGPDGHELVTWTSATTATDLSPTASPPPPKNLVVNTGLFYTSTSTDKNGPSNYGITITYKTKIIVGPSEPCPDDFRVAFETYGGKDDDGPPGDYYKSDSNKGASFWINNPLKLVAPKLYRDGSNGKIVPYNRRLIRGNRQGFFPGLSNQAPQFVIEGGNLELSGNTSGTHYDRRMSETNTDPRGSLDAYPLRCVQIE